MEENQFELQQLETFVYDIEKISLLNFNTSEYDINQTAVILRKLLIDSNGIVSIWKFLFKEKFKLLSLTPAEEFDPSFISKLKLHIPFIDILPIIRIYNYFAIRANNLQDLKDTTIEYPEIKHSSVNISQYISENYIMVDSKFISRKDIIEFLCYGKGAVHYGVEKKKVDRLSNVKKLNFTFAMGEKKADALFTFKLSYRSAEEEKKYRDHPDFTKFMVQLGNKHSFETLMQLQIGYEILNSPDVLRVYYGAKQHLINKTYKFRTFDVTKLFNQQ